MAPPKTVCPVVASLRTSTSSCVYGCPGVPRSIPRIETVIELRTSTGSAFELRSVGVEIRTIQKVNIPSKLGSTDAMREYKWYEDPMVFRPPVGEFSKELLGVDIPLLIPIPRDVIASGQFPNWTALTTHKLYVKVACGSMYSNEVSYIESFPIAIKLYDTLPLYRQFNVPVVETRESNDKQVLVDLSLPISCIGPKDEITIFINVKRNASNNKSKKDLRLNKITVQLKEVLECHEGGLPLKKEYKIFTKSKEFNHDENLLNFQGISHKIQHDYPVENDFLQLFSKDGFQYDALTNQIQDQNYINSTLNISRNRNIDKINDGIPITHIQGFTTLGKLFSFRYEIIVKIKLISSKDLEIRLPVVICPFDRVSSEYLLRWIMKECELARNKFGKNLINRIAESAKYDDICNLLKNYTPPPIVYNNTKADWVRLGYYADAFGYSNFTQNLVQYID